MSNKLLEEDAARASVGIVNIGLRRTHEAMRARAITFLDAAARGSLMWPRISL
jgi:hypothetical protein